MNQDIANMKKRLPPVFWVMVVVAFMAVFLQDLMFMVGLACGAVVGTMAAMSLRKPKVVEKEYHVEKKEIEVKVYDDPAAHRQVMEQPKVKEGDAVEKVPAKEG